MRKNADNKNRNYEDCLFSGGDHLPAHSHCLKIDI